MGEHDQTLELRIGRERAGATTQPEGDEEAHDQSGERPSFVPRSEAPTVDDSLPPPPAVLRSPSMVVRRVASPGRYAIVAPRSSSRAPW